MKGVHFKHSEESVASTVADDFREGALEAEAPRVPVASVPSVMPRREIDSASPRGLSDDLPQGAADPDGQEPRDAA